MNYKEIMLKEKEIAERYSVLPLREFITKFLLECGYDLNLMDNIYIDEYSGGYPNTWCCFKNGNMYISYYFDDYGRKIENSYSDPFEFMSQLVASATTSVKYDEKKNKGR